MHILIAKNRQVARVILATHLRSWGHHVAEAANASEVLAYATKNSDSLDALIIDWNAPDMNGAELGRAVRELCAPHRYLYVLLLTGREEFALMAEEFGCGGFDDYLIKPFDILELQLRVEVGNRLVWAENDKRLQKQILEDAVRRRTDLVRETRDEILTRLFSALESRDEETVKHVRRVGLISAHMGELLDWPENRIEEIKTAAPLHDIGKIGIPDMVLRKSAPLTRSEFKLITQHAPIGGRILSGSRNPIVRMAECIARCHHENWDGSGYPDGLQGEAIPIEARIVALADAYDALLCDRVYRTSLSEDKALRVLRSESGRKFDPALFELFIKNIDAIRHRCAEDECTAALPMDVLSRESNNS